MKTPDEHGFTLVELLVAVSLLAVIVSAAVPAFNRLTERERAVASTNTLVAHFQLARNTAISRKTFVTVCPTADGARCADNNVWSNGWMTFVDASKTGQPQSGKDILRVEPNNSRSLFMHSGGRRRVRFTPAGMAYGTNITVNICPQSGSDAGRAVIVSNPGRVRTTKKIAREACRV